MFITSSDQGAMGSGLDELLSFPNKLTSLFLQLRSHRLSLVKVVGNHNYAMEALHFGFLNQNSKSSSKILVFSSFNNNVGL